MSDLDTNRAGTGIMRRLAPDMAPTALGELVRYLLSTSALARDGFRILTPGWALGPFRQNPQFLFAHQTDQPTIGKVRTVEIVGDELRGAVEFAKFPFAQLIRSLVVDGFMPAVSVGFLPIEWDRVQPNVITKAELVECSAVPVGSLPTALAEAPGRGVDMDHLRWLADRALEQPHLSASRSEMAMMVRSAAAGVSRSGRVLSAANEAELRAAHQEIMSGHTMVASGADRLLSVCDQAAAGGDMQGEGEPDEDDAVGTRRRRAAAVRTRVRVRELDEAIEPLLRREARAAEIGRMSEADRRRLARSRLAELQGR